MEGVVEPPPLSGLVGVKLASLNIGGVGGSTNVTSLSDLSDVIISAPQNGQALVYDTLHGAWLNKTISTGGTADLSGYLSIADAAKIYFPKSGGTITGSVTINSNLVVKEMITGEGDILSHGGVTMYGG